MFKRKEKKDMDTNVIVTVLSFIGALIPIFTIVVKVNGTLTKLNITMSYVIADREEDKKELKEVKEMVNNHEKRIFVLEKRK